MEYTVGQIVWVIANSSFGHHFQIPSKVEVTEVFSPDEFFLPAIGVEGISKDIGSKIFQIVHIEDIQLLAPQQ